MSLLAAATARLKLLFARKAAESRMQQEFDFHIDLETDHLVREGLSRDEARRQALIRFGGVTRHQETLRDGRGLAWLGGFQLDLKLGMRMLRKYPGLTLVGGIAMAFAIWSGAMVFHIAGMLISPNIPLPDGDRIVQVANWDVEATSTDDRAVHDFFRWRTALTTVTDLGAYRELHRNLITAGGDARGIAGAEITASGFRVAAVAPLHGRALVPSDEAAGAPLVVVLGHDLWTRRFGGDVGVIGRTVHLGDASATVVGVMPEGFAFPVAHELWTQLKLDLLERTPRGGPDIEVFGRLAPGASLDAARAELATIGRRAAMEFPATHAKLEPRIAQYAKNIEPPSVNDMTIMTSIYAFGFMLLILVCGNVALLIFARAASREGELVVRSALGARRSRIVMQLFAEALVLGGTAAVVALLVTDYALRTWAVDFLTNNFGRLPFWYRRGLSPATVGYILALTVIAAAVAGMLPALKITRGLGTRLKEGTAGSGVKFGGVWTVVIVCQVAVTVAFPSVVFIEQRELRRVKAFDIGFAADQYLGVGITVDLPTVTNGDTAAIMAAHALRHAGAMAELRRRLEAEPGVAGVTFVDRLPRTDHREEYIEVDGVALPAARSQRWVSIAAIDPSYFDVLNAPVRAGRGFGTADLVPGANVAIVDQAFVDRMLQGRNALGRRFRFVDLERDGTVRTAHPWQEVVGVVKELGMTNVVHRNRAAGVYLAADIGRLWPVNVVLHAPGDPVALGPRVREIVAAVDPMLRITDVRRVDRAIDDTVWLLEMWLRVSLTLVAIAVLLSLAGIYAVLSFTIARRTREIGVRVALGASRPKLIATIFRRPLTHVAIGVIAGTGLIVLAAWAGTKGDGGLARVEGGASLANIALLAAYAALMLGVCGLACIVPLRRALRVEPTEALRAD